jgi:hypothetical protein
VSYLVVAKPKTIGGKYRVIDGMHRSVAVTELIEEGILPKDFKMAAMVFVESIPEDVAVDYATRTNSSFHYTTYICRNGPVAGMAMGT